MIAPHITSPSDLFSFSHNRNTMRLDTDRIGALKSISSSPKGMRATVDEQIDAWKAKSKHKDDPERRAGVGKHTRLGIGLPMSNIFATYVLFPTVLSDHDSEFPRYFGGSLELVSLDGWGKLHRLLMMHHF